jgi:hypothetical protein
VVRGVIERRRGTFFRCQIGDRDERDRLEVPAWMFDRASCAAMRMVARPWVCSEALTSLRWLLAPSQHDEGVLPAREVNEQSLLRSRLPQCFGRPANTTVPNPAGNLADLSSS